MKLQSMLLAALAAFFIGHAAAQQPGAVVNHAVPIGKGPGVTGFGSALPGAAGTAFLSNGPSADPTFQPVTGASFGVQSANRVFAGPTSGAAALPAFRALVGADLPLPAGSSLGGVNSLAAVANSFLTGLGTDGNFMRAQPAFSNLSGSWACSQAPALTGNVTSSAGSCATTIAALAVTNGMLAGSIAASKLVGTDIATVGTITVGTWNGSTIAGAYGGTGNAFMQFSGPASSLKTYTLPNASDTIATLTAAQTLTTKTINCANNTCTVRAASDITGVLPVANGGTGDSGVAWTSFTPTVTCNGGGPPTLSTNNAAYNIVGKRMFLRYNIVFSANNGCTGFVRASMPAGTTAAGAAVIAGQEYNSAGWAVQGFLSAAGISIFNIFKYDGSNPGDTNVRGYALSGTVEIQ